jgi:hypothetical protein
MAVIITGNNTPTAGGVTYGDGTTYANTAAGSAGGVLYSAGASAPAFSAAGTSGQLLQSNGASAPTWITAGASALTLLSTVTASDAATADIETTFNSTYDTYMIVASGVTFDSATTVACRMKIGGTYLTTSTYYYHTNVSKSSTTAYEGIFGEAVTSIKVDAGGTGGTNATVTNFVMMVYVPSSTTAYKTISWEGLSNRGDRAETAKGIARNDGTAALTGIRLYGFNGSSLISGKFRLYGIANS